MFLRIQLKSGNHLKLVSVCAPTMQRSQEEKELLYSQLLNVIKTNSNDHLIILGNFNARVGCDWMSWPNILGKHGVGRMNSNGLMLLDICTQNDLLVMGLMFQMKNSLKTTWKDLRSKHWHQFDHVLVNHLVRVNLSADYIYFIILDGKNKLKKTTSMPKYYHWQICTLLWWHVLE